MTHRLRLLPLLAFTLVAFSSAPASAQPVGTFRWQLEPWCNTVTLRVEQIGSVYRLDGHDDQCGAGPAAANGEAHLGTAPNTIVLGFTIVTAPWGRPVHVSATLTLPGASGTWQDSTGETGVIAYLTGAAVGTPRPMPASAFGYGRWILQGAGERDKGLHATVLTDTEAPNDAVAVYGQFGLGSRWAATGNAGVRGDSAGGIAVVGGSNTGTGVLGMSEHIGVEGRTTAGVGVLATTTGGATALEVNNGAIKVSGALRPVFVHTTTPANTAGHVTTLDHPLLNNVPGATVFVTRVWGSGGSTVNITSPLSVFYTGTSWAIFREDGVGMPFDARFNVMVVSQ